MIIITPEMVVAEQKPLHPRIIVDIRTDVSGWTVIAVDAFTAANGHQFSGRHPLPPGATWVDVRVTPDPTLTWEGYRARRSGVE